MRGKRCMENCWKKKCEEKPEKKFSVPHDEKFPHGSGGFCAH